MRLNFVRSLLNHPDILFLDEPTAGLDPGNARIMKDIILDLQAKGVTIFLTTHHMDDAGELCQRLAFMVEGSLPVIDSTSALKLKHGKRKVRVSYLQDQDTLTREFPMQDLANNSGFQAILQQGEVKTIHTLEASLEDIFLQVTGQQLKP